MLQHGGIAQRAQRFTKYRSVLLDDAGEGNHENYPLQPMLDRVIQRKGE